MIRKSRLAVFAAVVTLPLMAACAETSTAPELKIRRMSTEDSLRMLELGCGDVVPWGKAPCIAQQ